RFTGIDNTVEEREPFAIDALEAYAINQQWIEHQINNMPYSLEKLQAQGRWLSGINGELAFNQQQQAINEFTDLIQQQNLGQKQQDQPIDITIAEYRLVGNLRNLYENGSLIYRYAKLKGKDFMQAWIHHLIINQLQAQNTHLLSIDESLVFKSDNQQVDTLKTLIDIYFQGRQQPEAFFTEASFAYAKQALKLKTSNRAKTPAIVSAQDQLKKDIEFDRSLQQLYQIDQDLTELLNDDFVKQCEELVLPVWELVQ
ncbi:MAG: exodeoxyribonuclease V subunit gamma, partial [Methylococcales bacterium]|nr:exodeoxyribonuclease V subunit gamma [Methylococcales bacterium]